MKIPDAVAPECVLDHVGTWADLIVPLDRVEPTALLDAIEAAADTFDEVRLHQMHARDRRGYLGGRHGNRLRHVSYFLSEATREAFANGTIDLMIGSTDNRSSPRVH
jgi:hypothetical protein